MVTHACPRCEYDQSGAIASWPNDSCPIRGTCPECGYDFAWREVLSPVERRNPAFIEHCRPPRIFDSSWRTLAWTLLPWRFWRRVQLHHDVCGRRWPLWALCTILALHAALSFFSVFAGWRQNAIPGSPPIPFNWWYIADYFTLPVFAFEGGWESLFSSTGPARLRLSIAGWSPPVNVMAVMCILIPILAFALPQTRSRAKVRTRHVLRAAVFQWSWLLVPLVPKLAVVLIWSVNPLTALRNDYLWLWFLTRSWAIPLIGLGILWQLAWWGSALQIGWRIHRGLPLAAFLVLAAAAVAILFASLHDITLLDRMARPAAWFSPGGLYW